MDLLFLIVTFCLLGGLLSVSIAASFMLLPASFRAVIMPHSVSFAIGSLLGAAFIGLLPHALSEAGAAQTHQITLSVLLGLLLFFLLEKMVLWRHCHSDHCEVHTPDSHVNDQAAGTLILVGDTLHNFVDGVLIAGAFLTDVHLGIVTSIAVATHEIPQEVGDFLVLLHSGFSRKRALLYNMISSLATVVGGLLAFFSLREFQHLLPYVLAIAASSFIYVAVADLIPGLHKKLQVSATLQQISLIGAGIAVIWVAHSTLH